MIEDAKKGLFDVVIVHKMDRFSRNVRDTLNIESELAQYGVKVISVIEQFADTPEGQLQQIIQLGVGQYYSQNLAREVMKGLKENAYRCLHNGGLSPLGYDVDPITKQYIINEKEAESIRIIFKKFLEGWSYRELAEYLNVLEAESIRIIFKKFLEGWSYRELAEYLNVLGYRTKIGNKFSANSSFYDILVNSKYKGEYVFGRSLSKPKQPGMKRSHRKNKDESEIIRVPNGLPAIIDEGTFDQVQKLLSSRKRSKGATKAKDYDILVNSKYKGEYVFGRSLSKPKQPGMKRSHRKNKDESEIIRVPNGLPAIIDEGTFDQVQKLLSSRKRSKGATKAKEVYLVSGLIECGECGSAYHGSARIGGRNKQKYVSYRCSKRKKIENPCKCKEINRTLLDSFIVNQLFKTILNPQHLELLHQKVNEKLKEKISEMDNDLPKLEKQLAEVNQKVSNLVHADQPIMEVHELEVETNKNTFHIDVQNVRKSRTHVSVKRLTEPY